MTGCPKANSTKWSPIKLLTTPYPALLLSPDVFRVIRPQESVSDDECFSTHEKDLLSTGLLDESHTCGSVVLKSEVECGWPVVAEHVL